jgi:hypothetical protein
VVLGAQLLQGLLKQFIGRLQMRHLEEASPPHIAAKPHIKTQEWGRQRECVVICEAIPATALSACKVSIDTFSIVTVSINTVSIVTVSMQGQLWYSVSTHCQHCHCQHGRRQRRDKNIRLEEVPAPPKKSFGL